MRYLIGWGVALFGMYARILFRDRISEEVKVTIECIILMGAITTAILLIAEGWSKPKNAEQRISKLHLKE